MLYFAPAATLTKTEIALLVDETLRERATLREEARCKAARLEHIRLVSQVGRFAVHDTDACDLLSYSLIAERLSRLSDLRLALAMYSANRRAKCCAAPPWIGDWYSIKNVCAEEFAIRAGGGRFDGTLLEWGCRDGVLYCDAAGIGQFSFHIVDSAEPAREYPFHWTERRWDCGPLRSVPCRASDARINLRGFLAGDNQFTRGDLHNQFCRAGLYPGPVWEA